MGVDAAMLILPHERLSDEALEEIRSAFHERFPDEFSDGGRHWPDLKRFPYWGNGHAQGPEGPLIEVCILNRYFGLGVHRGGWPWLRDMGDWLAIRFGETAELRYGSDMAVEWDVLRPWPQARAECEALWAELVAADERFAEAEATYQQQKADGG